VPEGFFNGYNLTCIGRTLAAMPRTQLSCDTSHNHELLMTAQEGRLKSDYPEESASLTSVLQEALGTMWSPSRSDSASGRPKAPQLLPMSRDETTCVTQVFKKKHFRNKIWEGMQTGPTELQFNTKTYRQFLKTVRDVESARVVLCCMDAVLDFRQALETKRVCVYACSLLPAAPISPLHFVARPLPVLFLRANGHSTGRRVLATWYRDALNSTIQGGFFVREIRAHGGHYCISIEQLDTNSIKTTLDTSTLVCGNAACRKQGARLQCSRCQLDRYCDKACQRQAWKVHKKKCKEHDRNMTKLPVEMYP